jgi:hypothetical protein
MCFTFFTGPNFVTIVLHVRLAGLPQELANSPLISTCKRSLILIVDMAGVRGVHDAEVEQSTWRALKRHQISKLQPNDQAVRVLRTVYRCQIVLNSLQPVFS